jgi:enamine deaminase RidA (YjgF/YER057c/UK114 family)
MKKSNISAEFEMEKRPARTCIQAGSLPFNTRVEITATAAV